MPRLTKRAIDQASHPSGPGARCVLWDSEVPGFGCRLLPSGKKVFVPSYRAAGRKRLLTIGPYGVLTLDQARVKARATLAKIETQGADPLAEGNPYVLPGKRSGAHLVNISKPWGRVRTAATDEVRLHDLRRTVRSWLAQAGKRLHLIGRVLNHSDQSTTAIYARFGEDSVRSALEQHGARIMGAAGLAPTAEVAELPTKKRARP